MAPPRPSCRHRPDRLAPTASVCASAAQVIQTRAKSFHMKKRIKLKRLKASSRSVPAPDRTPPHPLRRPRASPSRAHGPLTPRGPARPRRCRDVPSPATHAHAHRAISWPHASPRPPCAPRFSRIGQEQVRARDPARVPRLPRAPLRPDGPRPLLPPTPHPQVRPRPQACCALLTHAGARWGSFALGTIGSYMCHGKRGSWLAAEPGRSRGSAALRRRAQGGRGRGQTGGHGWAPQQLFSGSALACLSY